ncbi:ABC transporter substrate-binding protein [Azospirillum brasilense]|uniref:ABC transporter substrate-binding protein n=1 Tax=Azospirillum brasilense TaxID=192 RepID=A0A0N7I956_AZOBR|nr:peptide ABC transporter substrate-binding protein [Azospirillum brasilense]PWC84324.1 peptide ABC transporter substrate-binding protein [Azospirillum sp. Sp 7]OPH17181.1 peptide ABC transporter substrate-binding protein [Azospirillum brasilense]OPH18237.1 peptide ABC transporter substrate-binding protein [Azospirillum brasilense]QCO13260.1 ABC transporter substrate-binding protein [Azospirillum brasilense]
MALRDRHWRLADALRSGTLKHTLPAVAALALLAAAPTPSQAATLTVGTSAEPSALDPHYHNLGPNTRARKHVFESLVSMDAKMRLQPELAESWRAVDETTWEFKLRKGVKFHDGTEFTAQDFVYTVCRIPNVANSPSSFTVYTKGIAGIEAPDPHTLLIKTGKPYPLLPVELSTFGIISAKAAGGEAVTFDKAGCKAESWPTTQAFNDGSLMIGTGPFKHKSYTKGDRQILERNPDYWGPQPAWDTVVFRPITSDGPRVAALLAGDVDMIESPPVQDIERLKSAPNVSLAQAQSNRVIYLALGVQDTPPTITGTEGKNPLKDPKVRKALSLAVDRDAIVKRIMMGVAEPANQYLPAGFYGNNPEVTVATDANKAKQLLAEAGYPKGFQLTLGTPNDRYINDDKVAQAVAQMFTRIGVQTQVDATTANVFFSKRNKQEYSVFLAGWGADSGEMSSPLKALIATPIKEKGYGTTNYTSYSDPELDGMLDTALATVDDAKREKLLQAAVKRAVDADIIIPLHYEVTVWAMKKGLSYEPRADQYTLAQKVTPAK